LIARLIPHSGESLPVVGLGTSQVFEVGDDPARRQACAEVLKTLVAGGGNLIDTTPSYSTAESVVGDLLAATGLNGRVFSRDQARRLRPQHRRRSAACEWKSQGLYRYIGITTSFGGDFDAVEAVARRQKPDFLQVNCPRHRRRGTGGIAKMRRDRLGPWLSSLEPTSLQKQRKLRFCPRIASIPWHNSI